MTGIEIVLFLAGCVFMVGSFFVVEKLSPSELSRISELSEGELKKIIDRGVKNADVKIENAIEERISDSADRIDRALEKETNEKIMAISEYSDTVLENINKTHNEIMFLYSMLNDKHTELTGMASDLRRLAADVRSLQENIRMPEVPTVTGTAETKAKQLTATGTVDTQTGMVKRQTVQNVSAQDISAGERDAQKEEILSLYKDGMNAVEIARKLKMGVGEVRLVIGLYRGE